MTGISIKQSILITAADCPFAVEMVNLCQSDDNFQFTKIIDAPGWEDHDRILNPEELARFIAILQHAQRSIETGAFMIDRSCEDAA